MLAGLASVAGAQSGDNMPEPPPPATRPIRTSPQPQMAPGPIAREGDAEGEDDPYEPVEDPNAAIKVPRTSCHSKEIRRVVVVGARRVDPEDVRATMKLRRGSTCTDPAVTRDAKALWNMAYFDDLQIESDPIGDGIKLTIRLVERPAIRKVIYKGNDEVDEDDIDETITLEPGTILSVPDVESQADAMRQLYSEEGFFLANVGYELRRAPGDTNQVDVVFNIDEGAEVEVRRITIVGNEQLPAAELLKIMQTNETGMFSFLSDRNKFSRAAFDEDLTRVQAWYYDKGYLMMRPGRPTVELTADRAYVDITIPVEEGPRFRIREFDIMETDGAGNEVETVAPKAQLRKMVKLKSGDWFSRSKIAEGIEGISRTYRDSGYALVEMVPGTDLDDVNHLVDVTINILRGPLVYIERIHVRGNTKTRDAVIRREFRLSEGDLYNQSKLEDGRALVNQLGYFERVDVSEEEGTARDKMVINVEVAEKPTGTFQVGAGFSSLESFIVTAQVQQQNLFGRGQTLGLNLQVSGIRQQIDLNFVEPWFLGSEWSLGFGLFKRIRDFRDFRQDSTGANITTGHPLFNPRFRIFLRYEFENVNISQPRGNLLGVGGQLANTFSNIFIARTRSALALPARCGSLSTGTTATTGFQRRKASSRTTRCKSQISTSGPTTPSCGRPRSHASTRRCSAPWSSRSTPKSGLITSRKYGPGLRAILPRRHLHDSRLSFAVGRPAGRCRFGGRSQPPDHRGGPPHRWRLPGLLQHRVGVPAHRSGRHQGRHLHGRRQRLERVRVPGWLRELPGARRTRSRSFVCAVRDARLPPLLGGLRSAMVLPARTAPLRMGHTHQPAASGQSDPLRVHHRPVILSE